MELLDQLHIALGEGYRIDRELGAAGMSRVFVATDAKLGRQVVVKILPPDLAAEVSIERFRRETLVAASLVHPHIVPLLSAGDFNGVPFYTMPFVERQSLRHRLDLDARLEVAEALDLARDVLGALDFAHRRNIVHRDIKPGNILISEGHAVVTDFGIARAITESRASTSLTQGAGIGTPEYMSPEQWTGEAVDGRTDIYAMACVLFEMLCGSTPFPAAAPKPLLTRVLMDPPPRVTATRADAPTYLDSVVQRALAKAAEDRFATAAEFASALAQRVPVAMARRDPSVAVLPFANISGDPSNDYLSDGITDELISSLTRAGKVRVVPRTSAFEFKGQNRDIRQIASMLGATHVLEGSIRIAGRRIRATAQLVDAGTGHPVWAERYDRELEDVFALQDEVTAAIIAGLLAGIGEDARFGSTRLDGAPARKALTADPTLVEGLREEFALIHDIGRGALSCVYLARRIRTGEQVAIKALVPDLAIHDTAVARFARQAELAASLRHPNVLRTFEVRQTPDFTCMISEFIDGVSLADILDTAGALPLDVAMAILAGAGAALGHGHEHGLIHTAFTPSNILLANDGRVVVTDFGIGNIQQPDNITAAGVTMGAPHYMSPEQLNADHLTPATDQYAFGIMGYRLLAGHLPFGGGNMFLTIQRTITDPIDRVLRDLRPDVPTALAESIYRMADKDPDKRYPTVAAALSAAGLLMSPEVAVRAISDFVRSPRSVGVVTPARSAVRAPGVPAAGKRHGGSGPGFLSGLGKRLAQLWEDQTQLRTPAADAPPLPTHGERKRMAESIDITHTGAPMMATGPDVVGTAAAKPTGRFPAYDAYLRGRYLINRSAQDWLARGRGRSRWPAAIAQFDEALRLDPTMTPAYAARAYTRTLMGRFGAGPARSLRDAALADVEVAVGRNPRFAEAHLVRGIIATLFDWSAADAREAFDRATELNANYAEAHLWRGIAASLLEQGSNAASLIQRALALDPLSTMGRVELALALYEQRDYGAALHAVDEALADKPTHAFGQYARASILTAVGRLDEALEAIHEALRIAGRQVDHLAQLAVIHGQRGASVEVASVIRELEARMSAETALAVAHLACADRDAAVLHVRRAIEAREPMLLAALAGPNLDALRDHAPFAALLREASIAPAEIAG